MQGIFLGVKLELHEIANCPSLQLHSGQPANRHGIKKPIFAGKYHQHAIKTVDFPMAIWRVNCKIAPEHLAPNRI